MNSIEIRKITGNDAAALQGQFKESAAFFLEPQLCDVEDFSGDIIKLWIILKKEEFLITFNENSRFYGLAFKNIFNQLVYLGDYKSLSDAYYNLVNRNE